MGSCNCACYNGWPKTGDGTYLALAYDLQGSTFRAHLEVYFRVLIRKTRALITPITGLPTPVAIAMEYRDTGEFQALAKPLKHVNLRRTLSNGLLEPCGWKIKRPNVQDPRQVQGLWRRLSWIWLLLHTCFCCCAF